MPVARAPLMNETEAASRLGVAPKTLERWRSTGAGPLFVRIGSRHVRYTVEDIEAWIASRRRASLAECAPEPQTASGT